MRATPSPLDAYVLSLAATPSPVVCFVATASGDADGYVERFHTAFRALPCTPTDLSLFRRDDRSLPERLKSVDVVYVGGGSTANLLAVWRLHGLDRALRERANAGPLVLAGLSAGGCAGSRAASPTRTDRCVRSRTVWAGWAAASARTTTVNRGAGPRTAPRWRRVRWRPVMPPMTVPHCTSSTGLCGAR